MCGQVAVGHEGSDTERPRGLFLDLVEGQPGEVDEGARRLDVVLHEVDEVGAAAEVAGAGAARIGGRGFLEAGGPYVPERLHTITSGRGTGLGAGPGVVLGTVVFAGADRAQTSETASTIPL